MNTNDPSKWDNAKKFSITRGTDGQLVHGSAYDVGSGWLVTIDGQPYFFVPGTVAESASGGGAIAIPELTVTLTGTVKPK